MTTDFFQGRRGIIATSHAKERSMQPILEKELGIELYIPDVYTSAKLKPFSPTFGKHSSTVERLRSKINTVLDLTDETLGFGNEGSFSYNHKHKGKLVETELVMLIDRENDFEVLAEVYSTNPRYYKQEIRNIKDIDAFKRNADFPTHGTVIIEKTLFGKKVVAQGITSEKELHELINSHNNVILESDMRALYNPTRMKVIKDATRQLLKILGRHCPDCGTPGMIVYGRETGLPCEQCQSPTAEILKEFYKCLKCDLLLEALYPEGKKVTSKEFCSICK